ncbi:Histidinol dehydrogenase, chloroplastic [Glycine soja]|nr:Histidinol dehydrogenase, chloroplastic [Glycine soja]
MTILEVLLNIFSTFLTYGCCSDALVEEEVGGNSVADIFKQHGETFFHNKEITFTVDILVKDYENSEAMISIDMPAGPSEVLVIADKHAIPSHVAADLLSQDELIICAACRKCELIED